MCVEDSSVEYGINYVLELELTDTSRTLAHTFRCNAPVLLPANDVSHR